MITSKVPRTTFEPNLVVRRMEQCHHSSVVSVPSCHGGPCNDNAAKLKPRADAEATGVQVYSVGKAGWHIVRVRSHQRYLRRIHMENGSGLWCWVWARDQR